MSGDKVPSLIHSSRKIYSYLYPFSSRLIPSLLPTLLLHFDAKTLFVSYLTSRLHSTPLITTFSFKRFYIFIGLSDTNFNDCVLIFLTAPNLSTVVMFIKSAPVRHGVSWVHYSDHLTFTFIFCFYACYFYFLVYCFLICFRLLILTL